MMSHVLWCWHKHVTFTVQPLSRLSGHLSSSVAMWCYVPNNYYCQIYWKGASCMSSVKLISKVTHVCGLSLYRQQSSKLEILGQNSANSWEPLTRRKGITACVTSCRLMRQLFAPSSAHRYQFWALLPLHQYVYVSILWSSTSSFFH